MSDESPSRPALTSGAGISAREMNILAQFIENLDRVEHLNCVERLEALRKILTATLGDLGFKHFAYHIARSSSIADGGRLPYIISNYPDSWVRHYFREHYLEDDPVVSHFLGYRRPFIWSEIAEPNNLNWRQRRLFDEARDAGVVNGMTLPIYSRGEVAAISVIPDEAGDKGIMLIRHNQPLLHLIVLRYHAAAYSALLEKSLTGDSTRRRTLLSAREKQVLEWTAKGKSTWEIAVVLGISHKSVEFHIEGAKRKLQVFNRTHAVAKAIMLNLLSFD